MLINVMSMMHVKVNFKVEPYASWISFPPKKALLGSVEVEVGGCVGWEQNHGHKRSEYHYNFLTAVKTVLYATSDTRRLYERTNV